MFGLLSGEKAWFRLELEAIVAGFRPYVAAACWFRPDL